MRVVKPKSPGMERYYLWNLFIILDVFDNRRFKIFI